MRRFLPFVAVGLAACGNTSTGAARPPAPSPSPGDTVNSIDTLIDDMRRPHEGTPHGVPSSFDWSRGPRLGMGNDPRSFSAFTAWGQVYEDAGGNPATNTRVQIRNMRAYLRRKSDGQWHLVQSSTRVEGAAYREDYSGNRNRPADVRDETDGTVSVKAGRGFNFHFWPASGRAAIDPADVAGVFASVQARLVVDDAALPDDRSRARYLLSAGADYWRSLHARWFFLKTNNDVAIGRFKYVESHWKAFNMSSVSAEELRRHPPPLE